MSHVYRARDTVIGRTVAVKVLTEAACQEADAKARFLREAKTAGNIVHENIINIFDFGVENDRPYMVMEFLRGQDLRQAIQNDQTGDLRGKLEIAKGLARALEHIHSLGIVHRDIKPDNVSIDPNGKVKLMDFGIAKSQTFNITRAGFTLGTPSYMAPEQVRGQQVTPLVDIYAFGLVLIELLTGQKPVQGTSISDVFTKILTQPVDLKPLEERGIPEEIIGLVGQMVEKDPGRRIQSMFEVRQHLDAILEGLGDQWDVVAAAGEQSEPASRVLPWKTIAMGAGGVLLAAVVIWMAAGGGRGGRRGYARSRPSRDGADSGRRIPVRRDVLQRAVTRVLHRQDGSIGGGVRQIRHGPGPAGAGRRGGGTCDGHHDRRGPAVRRVGGQAAAHHAGVGKGSARPARISLSVGQ